MKPCGPVAAREIGAEDTAEWPAAVRGGVEDNSSRPFDDIRRVLGAFEWVTFAYLAWLNVMLAVFHRNVVHAAQYFVIHCWIALGIICVAWAAAHSRNQVLRFARDWYPLPLYIFFFEELQGLVHAIFPGWFDRWLIQFDFNFAGVHPSVWLARFSNPALNDFMQFAYMTYFLYLVILPAILYAQKDRIAFWNVMVSTAIANYTVYFIAVLFPIESPYHALAAMNTTPSQRRIFHRGDRIHRAVRARARRRVSVCSCRRLDSGDSGVVAIPALALLGVPAIFCEHVRIDGLRTLSLYCGRAGGNCCGRAWFCGGKLADGAERRIG